MQNIRKRVKLQLTCSWHWPHFA